MMSALSPVHPFNDITKMIIEMIKVHADHDMNYHLFGSMSAKNWSERYRGHLLLVSATTKYLLIRDDHDKVSVSAAAARRH